MSDLARDIELYGQDKWHLVETVPHGMQVIIWEPMYGHLIACFSSFGSGKWQLKSSGNFWDDLPESVVPTHWRPLPEMAKPPENGT